jgi:alkanesulfonate monooxygenase SsuD/methylene tetrahydromethanopterin reductase-like flavin-dependent oxidoreductase (luciferase family)
MKFGVLFNLEYRPEIHGPPAKWYAEILDLVVLIERLGFHAAWFGEHHYRSYSFGNPAVIMAAASQRTTTIRLGTGVCLIPLHHPVLLAEEYAMLDVLSGGRLDFGVGKGYLNYGYEVLGADLGEAQARYEEGLALIDALWCAQGPVDFLGQWTTLRQHEFFPKPIQTPRQAIRSAATRTATSFIYAADHGYHLTTALFAPDQHLVREGILAYRKRLAERGLDPDEFEVSGVLQMYCGATKDEAMRIGKASARAYFDFFDDLRNIGKPGTVRSEFLDDLDRMDRENRVLFDDPAGMISRIKHLQHDADLDLLLFEVMHGGTSYADARDCLIRFAHEVLPHFTTSSRTCEAKQAAAA